MTSDLGFFLGFFFYYPLCKQGTCFPHCPHALLFIFQNNSYIETTSFELKQQSVLQVAFVPLVSINFKHSQQLQKYKMQEDYCFESCAQRQLVHSY